ncbi:MAG TPA: hypothetical protein PLV84_03435, partial [Deltaproteobacteria bacterium]|nr:hypothetical protein [Deltaproteobacteria bacterium]
KQPAGAGARQSPHNEEAGFEDFIEDNPKPAGRAQGSSTISPEQLPGFEDYLEDKPKTSSAGKGSPGKPGMESDTPGFEDYLDK